MTSTSTADSHGASAAAPRAAARLGLVTGFVLLLGTGGVDAYTFLRHGHVFAEAMTGNLVLIAVGAADPRIVEFWRPLVSYGAFLAGVLALWLAGRGRPPESATTPRPQLLTLGFEIVVLLVIGALAGQLPQEAAVALTAFAAGMQISAFRRVDEASLSTVVMTTNSMQAIGDVVLGARTGDREGLLRARGLLVAIVGFIAGAFAGAGLSSALHDRAAWPLAGIFLVAGILYLVHDLAGPSAPRQA